MLTTKERNDKIYLVAPDGEHFTEACTAYPIGAIFKKYIGQWVIEDFMERVHEVCGSSVARWVEKQFKEITADTEERKYYGKYYSHGELTEDPFDETVQTDLSHEVGVDSPMLLKELVKGDAIWKCALSLRFGQPYTITMSEGTVDMVKRLQNEALDMQVVFFIGNDGIARNFTFDSKKNQSVFVSPNYSDTPYELLCNVYGTDRELVEREAKQTLECFKESFEDEFRESMKSIRRLSKNLNNGNGKDIRH